MGGITTSSLNYVGVMAGGSSNRTVYLTAVGDGLAVWVVSTTEYTPVVCIGFILRLVFSEWAVVYDIGGSDPFQSVLTGSEVLSRPRNYVFLHKSRVDKVL